MPSSRDVFKIRLLLPAPSPQANDSRLLHVRHQRSVDSLHGIHDSTTIDSAPIVANRDRHRPVADNFGVASIATGFIDTTIVYNFAQFNSDRAVFDEPTIRRCASQHQQRGN